MTIYSLAELLIRAWGKESAMPKHFYDLVLHQPEEFGKRLSL